MKPILALTGLAAALVAVTQAHPAAARPQPGDVPQRMAICLYERYPAPAQKLLQSTTAREAEDAYAYLLEEPVCASRVIGNRDFTADEVLGAIHLMRGMLAEQALAGLRTSAKALPALPVHQKQYVRPWFAASGRQPAVDEMAACVADTNPAAVLALLDTAPSSAGEGAAMGRLDPAIKRCLTANLRLMVAARPIRAALADALYQRVRHPQLSLASAPETAK
jgi:hypothetical protein